MNKTSKLQGVAFIIISLLIGSLFTASVNMVWGTHELTWWALPLIAGTLFFIVLFLQVLVPVYRDYKRPKTQRQHETYKPYYIFIVMILMIYVCLCIALGGIWVYYFKGQQEGIRMGAAGLILMACPLAYIVLKAIRMISK